MRCSSWLMGSLFVLSHVSCATGSEPKAVTDADLPVLAEAIEHACPSTADSNTAGARDACGSGLAQIRQLAEATINGTLRWGAATQDDYLPGHNSLTALNTLVWCKLYLSLFAYTGEHTVQILPDESRLLRLNVRLRALPNSQYPYPFWHSAAKWRSYQQASQVGLLFKGGKLIAGYRNAQLDPTASTREQAWSGFWTTDEAGQVSPRTALFEYLLSPDNPQLGSLGAAYKAFANEARKYACGECHNPANPIGMNPLLILNLPNQALAGRHQIVWQISRNQMPPGRGISDNQAREQLLRLALQFEKTGDDALSFEEKRRALN
jgi:hypothetical protein